MTSDHMSPLLSHERDSELLVQVCSLLARGDVPGVIIEGDRLGRLTTLNIRRFVARTMAKTNLEEGRESHCSLPVRAVD